MSLRVALRRLFGTALRVDVKKESSAFTSIRVSRKGTRSGYCARSCATLSLSGERFLPSRQA